MGFKDYLKLIEAGDNNPLLKMTNQQISNALNNMANAPSQQGKTAGDLAKQAMVDVARRGKAPEIEALTNQVKNPAGPGAKMMKKKMKKKMEKK